MGVLTEKDLHGDMQEDPDEAGDIEPLNSDESSLPVDLASPPPCSINLPTLVKEIKSALTERTIMTS